MKAPPQEDHRPAKQAKTRRPRELPSPPAKITAPAIPHAYRRTRLFGLLDHARRTGRMTWVAAPAGAGKTTLVVSYIESRRLECLWYQIDPGDRDPASFFHYLGLAVAQAAPRFRRPLPKLTPEYLGDLPVFARNFFRELGRRMRPPFVLVLDNMQDLPAGERLHGVLSEGLSELPRGGHALLLSRAEPPEAFARVRVNQQMAGLGWSELRLTEDELHPLVRVLRTTPRAAAPAVAIESLHRRCDGWIAGLILLLGAAERDPNAAESFTAATNQMLFDYFAGEVFARRPPAVQDFLVLTSLFPSFTANMAERLTGSARAHALLDDLVRQHHFTERRMEPSDSYEYHALFREFLLAQAQTRFTPEEWRALRRTAAQILIASGQHESAAALMQQSGDHAGLEALIHEHSGEYAASGRLNQLEQWLRALPAPRVRDRPWLAYWMGVCRMPFDLPEARAHFESAYARFDAQDDAPGLYLALAAILDTFAYQWDDFAPVRGWLDELDRLEQRHSLPAPPALQSQVIAAVLGGACFGYPQYPRLPQWAARAETLLGAHPDIGDITVVASKLALYYGWIGNFASLRALVDPMRRLVQSRGAAPLARLYAHFILAQSSWLTGAPEAAERYAQEGLAESERSGVHVLDSFLLGIACFARGLTGNTSALEGYLERMRPLLQPGRRLDFAHYHYESARSALLQLKYPDALAHADTALKTTQAVSCDFPSTLCRMAKAEALVALARYDEAAALAEQVREFAHAFGSRLFEFEHLLMQAWIALCRGERPACGAALVQAFALGRAQRYVCCYSWSPAMMSALCVFALEQGIEVDYARRLVRERGLVPEVPPLHIAAWPWKVKLYTLGRFAVLLDDKPLKFSIKAQKKPLELLKSLVAFGGMEVREDKLAEALWPQAEADSAAFALTTTLHRLRKLIGEAAIERREGRLTLDPRHCWVDVWFIESQLASIEQISRASSCEGLAERIDRLLALYRGPFLADQREESWVLSTRERLRGKFLRAMDLAADAFAGARRHEQAIHCLEKALEIDPLVENFYRWIMQAHLAQGHHAEAFATYRRCRRILASHLGLEPSADTEALRQQIPCN